MSEKLESTLVGVAGEYLAAGELTLRGYVSSITLRNSRGIDIIASNSKATKSVSIQVKSNSNGGKSWILSKKAETCFSDNHFYIFVALKKLGERPSYHIVPSNVIAEITSTSHANWLKGTKIDGTPRKDSNMRKFDDPENQFLEKWEYISQHLK